MNDWPRDPSEEMNVVITPGGPRPQDHVRAVGPGDVISAGDVVPTAVSQNESASPGKESSPRRQEEYVITPGGLRHRSLVHRVGPEHALVVADGQLAMLELASGALIDVLAGLQAKEAPTVGSGWISYAYWEKTAGQPISSFRTTWGVPPPPAAEANQVIFLFNGIQDLNHTAILQPVLQWGASGTDGGPYWAVGSWYVTSDGRAFHSQIVPVHPGDTLVGVLSLTDQTDGSFGYQSEFEGISGTTLMIRGVAEMISCCETLEAYFVNQCSDYPATDTTVFSKIHIRVGESSPAPGWTPKSVVTDCGQHATVVIDSSTNGQVDVHYQAGTG